jgi:hypothetical protein
VPENRLSRRAFVGAVAALGVTAMSGTALGAPLQNVQNAAPNAVDRAIGVARLGRTVHVLGRARGEWVRIGADGTVSATRGLGGATVEALAARRGVLVAVGADGIRPAVWESADGLSWRRTLRLDDVDGHLTAVGAHDGAALAVGARLTLERAPHQRIVLRHNGSRWATVATRGLARTDELTATAVGGDATGWTLATVDATGSLLARSADGVTWTHEARLTDAAVKAFEGADWAGNAMGGTTGVVRTRRAVPAGQAVGLLDGRSYWLVDGHIVTATV